ncbi:hypothetical protein LINGRAHAP2_LOCUS2054 [Linum grandiflorum]
MLILVPSYELVLFRGAHATSSHHAEFWADNTKACAPRFQSGKHQGTHFQNPLFRFLAQSFGYTIVPRNDSHGHMGSRDLFLLRLMLDSTQVHLGYLVSHAFHLHVTNGASGLLCGAYITRVAHHLGLLEQFHGVPSHPPYRLDSATLVNMGLLQWVPNIEGQQLEAMTYAYIPGDPVDFNEEAELDAMFRNGDEEVDAQPAAAQSDDLSLAAAVHHMMLEQRQFFEET